MHPSWRASVFHLTRSLRFLNLRRSLCLYTGSGSWFYGVVDFYTVFLHLHGSMLPDKPWPVLSKPWQTKKDIKFVIQIQYDEVIIVLLSF
uniref:Uncharacterized protein n=1 Tax=Peronospora matthiolae TaxID=2874970 RepID=A0AAV1T8S6_9STRA